MKIRSQAVAQSLAKPSASTGLPSLDAKLQRAGATNVQKMFRHKPIPLNSGIPDISRILKVHIPKGVSPVMLARELGEDPNVEYAEPMYLRRLRDVPNDSLYALQQHLPQIHAPDAWDIQEGDSTVIIGIVDTGVDMDHEDLEANVWTNAAEATGTPGVDDDGNGFVDDIHGWDFGNDDADPTDPPGAGHGTHCAGLACAVTNNRKGVAGASWNCTVMPVKESPDSDWYFVYFGYEGIVYAADNGADVISNSWGGPGYSKWEQDVIDYAHAKGAIIVAASGNDNASFHDSPSSYRHVISVAAVHVDDRKATYSNFGPWIDVCSPGGDQNTWILSTIPDNEYAAWGGTSMATPIVAGVCGLVKSAHRDWTNDQIVRQLLLSADNIDALNPQYLHGLGHGRVNAFRALTDTLLEEPDARLALLSFSCDDSLYGDGDGVLERGETIQLQFDIQNCSIGTTDAARVQLSCTSAGVDITQGTAGPVSFPADTTLPFDFTIAIADDAVPENAELVLTLETGSGYSREERVEIAVGNMPVLFVDNDLGVDNTTVPDVELFFHSILDHNQILYGNWDTQVMGFPLPATLQAFPIVVLSCSWIGNVSSKEVLDALRTYLDGGGNLFICGQDVAWQLQEGVGTPDSRAFLHDYLHVEFITDDSQDEEVSGVEGEVIGRGMSFHIWQPAMEPSGKWDFQWPDVIQPTEGAAAIFTYRDGRAAGVQYAGNHKVVYLGFGLEAVDSYRSTQIGDPSPKRTELLLRILNWLSVIQHDPRTDVTRNDSSLTVSIRFSGSKPEFQAPTLFWRARGDSDFTLVPMADLGLRHYAAGIPAPDSGNSMEYYFETTHPYYTWTSPVTAPAALHAYPVPAYILVDNKRMDIGDIRADIPRRDSSFLVRNVGGSADSLYVSVDPGNVSPESAITVSPTAFVLERDSSQWITVSIYPQMLQGWTYNALVWVKSRTSAGPKSFAKLITFTVKPVIPAVGEDEALPRAYALHQNFPNPFNPTTTIRYELPQQSHVTLKVFNILGEEVATLVTEECPAGRYSVSLDATNLSSGIYLYRLTTGQWTSARKMTVMK